MTAQHAPRREERVLAALPVRLGDALGVTHDVSANGLYFEVGDTHAVGSELDFSVELEGPTGSIVRRCHGRIVRTDRRGVGTGVAVKITESILEAAR